MTALAACVLTLACWPSASWPPRIGWVPRKTCGLPIGYFGASTGAAAALVAAAQRPEKISAIVSRGGRPDLAGSALPLVKAPTLLIVGGNDTAVIQMNRTAATELQAPHSIEIIPNATHLFEEPGTLAQVARLAGLWFTRYLFKAVPN